MWAPILEKAFAKRFGNYEHIVSGAPSDAIRALTGSPYVMYQHKNQDVEMLWQLLTTHDKNDDFITCGMEGYDESTLQNQSGLSTGNAYTVLGTIKLNSGVRLVKIRNPWGADGFPNAYSDSNLLWDEQAKAQAGIKNEEGVFFVDIDTYLNQFSETWISFDVSQWANARFLKLNDKSQLQNPGIWEGVCGSQCTRHTMTLKADMAQTIYLTAYTWDERGIPDDCEKQDNNLYHAIVVSNLQNVYVWNYGNYQMEPFRINAGE